MASFRDLTPGNRVKKIVKFHRNKKYEINGEQMTIREYCSSRDWDKKEMRAIHNYMRNYDCDLIKAVKLYESHLESKSR